MRRYVDVVAGSYIAYGWLTLAASALALALMWLVAIGLNIAGVPDAWIVFPASLIIPLIALPLSVPWIAAGFLIHRRSELGRIAALLLGVLAFLDFGIGTLMATGAFVVLSDPDVIAEFK